MAREGKHDRGFTIVADEVRKLAEESDSTVSNIQNIISQVQEVFTNLSHNVQYISSILDHNVTPDYELIVSNVNVIKIVNLT